MRLHLNNKSVTLLELLIAIALLSVIVLGFSSIDLFSRYHLMTSDRRAKLQNEVSYVLEHMTKEISKAIGDITRSPINTDAIAGDAAIRVYVDNGDGIRGTTGDHWAAYRFTGITGADAIQYCSQCTNNPCTQCNPSWDSNILSKNINTFTPIYSSGNNYVDITLTACWDPDGTPNACGTPDNPSVTMKTSIKMPSVSTH